MSRVAVGSLLSLALAVLPLRAQIINDGANATLTNVINNITGTVTVGTNGSFTSLTLSDNAFLTNTVHGVIGLNASAKSNEVRLISASARWLMGNNLFVGSNGAFNRLVVSNGAFLNNNSGFIGNGASSSNNFALITGSGSFWTNRSDLRVGVSGRDNQMIVSNGARVVSFGGELGSQPGSSNNLVVVTGTGSVWTNVLGGWVSVGGGERGNRLIIEAGGQVGGDNGVVGTGSFGSDSEALVTGPGSLWSSRADAVVGLNPSNNRLVVSNGAAVVAGNNGRLGAVTGATNNVVVVTGAGSLWSNQFELYVGEGGPRNRMEVNGGGWVVSSNTYVGFGGASNLALVTGAGSTWSNRAGMFVGNSSSANQLVVSNGGSVVSRFSFVGNNAGANGNLALVTGAGSLWNNGTDLDVGISGAGNGMMVSNAALVVNSNAFIGANASAFGNLVLVTGSGSLWSNRGDLVIGRLGPGNRVEVRDGGAVRAEGGAALGLFAGADFNTAVVAGAGSSWSLASQLVVGSNSAFNSLVVSNSGRLVSSNGFLGFQASSSNNTALISGAGSVWTNRGSLIVGRFGAGNELVISNGAFMHLNTGTVLIGQNASSSNNLAVITGPGSSWTIPFLAISSSGSGNRLVVSDGGVARNEVSEIGAASASSNNELLVSGAGSLSTNSGLLFVGRSGNQNRLVVSNAATVVSATGVIVGDQPSSTNNRVLVDTSTLRAANVSGTGFLDVRRGTNVFNSGLMVMDQLVMTNALSRFEFNGGTLVTRGAVISNTTFTVGNAGSVPALWEVRAGASNHYVAGEIFVGGAGSFAQLIHTNGALLTNGGYAALGIQAASGSNSVTLAGPGSRWWLGDGVLVGDGGSGNRLVVSNGASLVTARISYFGDDVTSTNNEAVVTGPGSSWFTANYGLRVGYEGSHNRLAVSGGGLVSSFDDVIGNDLSSSNNQVLVTGSGSLWNNTGGLAVGLKSAGNQLVVSNGAAVFTGGLAILGADTNASRNSVLVTDPGSSWLINSYLFVGSNGPLCRLVITNGALVVSQFGALGGGASSSNNFATVTGPGTAWNIIESLLVGRNGKDNQLLVSDGARLSTKSAMLSEATASSGNSVLVRGAGTLWTNTGELRIGGSGIGNRLTVTNGARVESEYGSIGVGSTSRSNEVVVSGPNSLWRVEFFLSIGEFGSANRLVITNGGRLIATGEIGGHGTSSNNEVVVTGPGSTWTASSVLYVGDGGSGNRLVIRDGGEVIQDSDGLTLGGTVASLNNRVLVDGGSLRLINTNLGLGVLDVLRGTNVLNAGLIEAQQLLLTNAQGLFEFNSGTLSIGNSSIGNGQQFRVGNGVSPAALLLKGNGSHAFGPAGVSVSSNGVLTGSGTASGALAIQAGGLLSPGTPIGRLSLTRIVPPTLQGTTLMEISKTGSALTNDLLQVISVVAYGGSLIVSNRGPDALAAGDRFVLFIAAGFSGSFTNVTLPPLSPGLTWTNKLLVDGSVEVITAAQPGFSSIDRTGTNLVFSGTNGPANASYAVLAATNVALPLSNWVILATNQFDSGGAFSFTNSIDPGIQQRFFRLSTP